MKRNIQSHRRSNRVTKTVVHRIGVSLVTLSAVFVFVSRNSPGAHHRFHHRLHHGLHRSLQHSLHQPAASSNRLIFKETKFNGLGAQTLRIIDALALANAIKIPLCFYQGRYWNYGCAPYQGWNCYFTSLLGSCKITQDCVELSHVAGEQFWLRTCILISTASSYTFAAKFLHRRSNGSVQQSRQLAQQVWLLNKHTENNVQTIIDQLKLPTHYIALHIRRGDKAKETPLLPMKRYAQAVNSLSSNNGTIFVATDDGSVLSSLRHHLRAWRIVAVPDVVHRAGHDQLLMNRLYLNKNAARVTILLAEIEALRGAQFFIGTFSSNLGRLVHVLREQSAQTSISLDDAWAPGVAWRTFGHEYCISEQANKLYCTRIAHS